MSNKPSNLPPGVTSNDTEQAQVDDSDNEYFNPGIDEENIFDDIAYIDEEDDDLDDDDIAYIDEEDDDLDDD